MSAPSPQEPEDLQHFLPASVRKTVAAVPVRSLNLGIGAFALVSVAAGVGIGGWLESGRVRSWLMAGLVVAALLLGAVARRYEARLLGRFARLEERDEERQREAESETEEPS